MLSNFKCPNVLMSCYCSCKYICGVFHFWFRLVFTKVYISVQQKVWTLTLKEHEEKTINPFKQESFSWKSFSGNVESISKKLWKMISAYVKANVN